MIISGQALRASHCVYKIRYHIVFCIKYRKSLLAEQERIDYFKQILSELSKRFYFEFEAVGTDSNHVHLFMGASPTYAPSRIVQIVKSITARELFREFPKLKKFLWGGEFWSDGFYIATVGDGGVADVIKAYVEKQGTNEEKEDYKQMKLFEF